MPLEILCWAEKWIKISSLSRQVSLQSLCLSNVWTSNYFWRTIYSFRINKTRKTLSTCSHGSYLKHHLFLTGFHILLTPLQFFPSLFWTPWHLAFLIFFFQFCRRYRMFHESYFGANWKLFWDVKATLRCIMGYLT